MELYDILVVKNAFVQSVPYVTKYTICNLVWRTHIPPDSDVVLYNIHHWWHACNLLVPGDGINHTAGLFQEALEVQ